MFLTPTAPRHRALGPFSPPPPLPTPSSQHAADVLTQWGTDVTKTSWFGPCRHVPGAPCRPSQSDFPKTRGDKPAKRRQNPPGGRELRGSNFDLSHGLNDATTFQGGRGRDLRGAPSPSPPDPHTPAEAAMAGRDLPLCASGGRALWRSLSLSKRFRRRELESSPGSLPHQ